MAERFVLHDRIVNYRDAVVYQRDAERLDYEPFSDDEMAKLKKAHDDLIARFGPPFGGPYGWAIGLPGLPKPNRPAFDDLEVLAGLDHFRGIYRWSSHYIHGDSKALRLAQVERGGSSAVLTNATNNMLADPGAARSDRSSPSLHEHGDRGGPVRFLRHAAVRIAWDLAR